MVSLTLFDEHCARTCCQKSNMDWDDFMKIPGCSAASHSDLKPERPQRELGVGSQTISPSPHRIILSEAVPVTLQTPAQVPVREQVPWVTGSGLHKCVNLGCVNEFDPNTNSDDSCQYHCGKPNFRDCKKYWTCCDRSAYDWDDFMKLEKCCVGKHSPKMVDLE
jgi:hypothetical protein